MKKYIYGAGGLGKDVLGIAQKNGIKISGFIDDKSSEKQKKILNFPVYSLDEIEEKSEVVIAIGDPLIKKIIYQKILKKNLGLFNIISRHAILSEKIKLGKGIIIYPFTFIGNSVIIENNVLICANTSIGHDVIIKNNNSISFNSTIGGATEIFEGCYIGSGSHIRDEIKIKENCLIGMGSVVTKNVSSDIVIYGNPAIKKGSKGNKKVF